MKKNLLLILCLLFIFVSCVTKEAENRNESKEEGIVKNLSSDIFASPDGFRDFSDKEMTLLFDQANLEPLFMVRTESDEPLEMFLYYKSKDEDLDFDFIERSMREQPNGNKLKKSEISRDIVGYSFDGYSFSIKDVVYYELISTKKDGEVYVVSYLYKGDDMHTDNMGIDKFYKD